MKKYLVLAAMVALCTACTEVDTSCAKLNGVERCDLSQADGAVICDNSGRYINNNGTYVAYPCDAGYACINNGVCTRMPDYDCALNPSYMECNAQTNTLMYCSGGFLRYEVCPSHTVCTMSANNTGYCRVVDAGSCVAGSERCDVNGVHQVCADLGGGRLGWSNSPCKAGMVCSSGKCVVENACIPNDKRCYYDKASGSNIVQVCSEAQVWTTNEVCSGETSACNNGTCVAPGSESNPNDDYYVCTSEVCTEEGDTCGELCVAEGYDNMAWCDDQYVYCEEPQGGGSNPGGSGDYVNCSAETCTMQDGSSMSCGEACIQFAGEGNEAWCTADGKVTCSPTDPSGGSSNPGGSGDYFDCSTEICTEAGDTCVKACNDAGYTTDKAWCDDEYVYCSDPNGGSNPGGGSNPDTGDIYDCSSEICTEAGDTCLKACNDAGYTTDKAWCDDEYVYCSDPNGGGSNPGGGSEPDTGDFYDCSSEICTQQGDTCLKACNDAGYTTDKAWCDDEYVYCSDPNGSGSNPGGGSEPDTGDIYDCSSEICTEAGDTCVKACNDAGYTTDKAWCDDEYVYCSDPNGSGSNPGGGSEPDPGTGGSCVYGEYEEHCNGEVVYYCGSNGTVETLDCSPYASQGYACKAFNMADGSTYADCLTAAQTCSSVGAENAYCEEYSNYGNVEFVDICSTSSTDGKNYWVTSDMAQCATETAPYGGECNAAGTACAL